MAMEGRITMHRPSVVPELPYTNKWQCCLECQQAWPCDTEFAENPDARYFQTHEVFRFGPYQTRDELLSAKQNALTLALAQRDGALRES